MISGVLAPIFWTCPLILAGAACLSGYPVGVAALTVATLLSILGAGILLQKAGTISGFRFVLAE